LADDCVTTDLSWARQCYPARNHESAPRIKERRFSTAVLIGQALWRAPLLDAPAHLAGLATELVNRTRKIVFVKKVFFGAQSGFLRISADVSDAITEMTSITHEAIKIVALPKGAGSFRESIDLPSAEALPSMQNFLKRRPGILSKQDVDVIWHDRERNHHVSLRIKMKKRVGDNSCTSRLPQNARTVAGIQPAFQ
jgi:hypothetical protein